MASYGSIAQAKSKEETPGNHDDHVSSQCNSSDVDVESSSNDIESNDGIAESRFLIQEGNIHISNEESLKSTKSGLKCNMQKINVINSKTICCIIFLILSILGFLIFEFGKSDEVWNFAKPSRVNRQPSGHATMVPVVWDNNNQATIEFCQQGDVYGYRLLGEKTCGPAGIVIRMKPGQKYHILLHNDSDEETTNLHTHGLHIRGIGNADDVTRFVEPNKCLLYTWNIPKDHMGGTFWLHAHFHGYANPQVAGGAYAMLIVEDSPDILDNVVVANNDNSDIRDDEIENIRSWMDNELHLIVFRNIVKNKQKEVIKSEYLANGETHTTFEMINNQWYHLRLSAIDISGSRSQITFPEQCDVHTVSYDGVWKFQTPSQQIQREFYPTGASRIDVAIRCKIGAIHDSTSYPLFLDQKHVATFHLAQGENRRDLNTATSPFLSNGSSWEPKRPSYLNDLRDSRVAMEEIQSYQVELVNRTINGQLYDPKSNVPMVEIDYDTIQEWRLLNTDQHPFHMHVFHMQTFTCTGHEDGEYYDTISTLNANDDNCRVRFRAIDFSDKVIIHCHNIRHEDQGMMVFYNIINGGPTQAQSYYLDFSEEKCPNIA